MAIKHDASRNTEPATELHELVTHGFGDRKRLFQRTYEPVQHAAQMNYSNLLPGQALDDKGRRRLDYSAIFRTAVPLMVNSAIQAGLNITDTWFVSRLSPSATAAIGAVYWPVLVFIWLLGGVSLAVQPLAAQAYGGRRYARAAGALWIALWLSIVTVPPSVFLALSGKPIFSVFGLPVETLSLAVEYWTPRMLGAPLAIALIAALGFFNGIGKTVTTLKITVAVGLVNAVLNQLFMFVWGFGIAGSAWATNVAQSVGLMSALLVFLDPAHRRLFRSNRTYRLTASVVRSQCRFGLPMGVQYAADILAFAIFQLMQVRLGTIDGAATQLVMVLTSFCYMPAIGISTAGTTFVGQSIGVGDADWAYHIGNRVIFISVGYMTTIGFLLAAAGPWILPYFTAASDPGSAEVRSCAAGLLWIAAGYQDLRWAEHQCRKLPARHGRYSCPLYHGVGGLHAVFRSTSVHIVVQTGPGMDNVGSPTGLWRCWRLVCSRSLCLFVGFDAFSSMALPLMAKESVNSRHARAPGQARHHLGAARNNLQMTRKSFGVQECDSIPGRDPGVTEGGDLDLDHPEISAFPT